MTFLSRGWTPGVIRMGQTAEPVSDGFIRAFRGTRYGLYWDTKVTNGDVDTLPKNVAMLYRIIDDASSPTGYSCEIIDESAIYGWANFQFASGAWFDLTFPTLSVSDTVIVVREQATISRNPASIRLIVRDGDSIAVTGNLRTGLGTTLGLPNLHYAGDSSFVWGYASDTLTSIVEGIRCNGASIDVLSSTTFDTTGPAGIDTGNPAQYGATLHYDGSSTLIGRKDNTNVWAMPFNHGRGYLGAPTASVLPGGFSSNFVTLTGIEGTANYLFEGTSPSGNRPAQFSGGWIFGAQDLGQFPLPGAGSPPVPSQDSGTLAFPNLSQFVQIGSVRGGSSPNFVSDVQWATVSLSGGVLTLTGQNTTNIKTATTGFGQFTVRSSTQHTDNLCAVNLQLDNSATRYGLYAFAH